MFRPVLNFASRPSPFVSHHPVRDSKFDLLFEHLATSAFAQPLFSWSYELRSPQVLYFLNNLGCRGLSSTSKLLTSSLLSVSYVVNLFVSESCGLFIALCAFLRAPVVCFQSLADSFCKTPGWGYVALATPKSQGHDSFSSRLAHATMC